MQAAAAAGSPALVTLLRATPPAQLQECSNLLSLLLHGYLTPFTLVFPTRSGGSAQLTPSTAALVDKFWQRVREHPAALEATGQAVQACPDKEHCCARSRMLISQALDLHVEFLNPDRNRPYAGWHHFLGSDSLQQYAMDGLDPTEISNTGFEPSEDFQTYLSTAGLSGLVSEARLGALLTHDGILAPIRAAAEGRQEFRGCLRVSVILGMACEHFGTQRRNPGGSPAALRAVQSTLMAAIRQGAALRQVLEMAAGRRQRAVRRAQETGFLQVHSLISVQAATRIA